MKKVTSVYGAHAVICTAGAAGANKQALRLLRNGGPIICVGLAEDNLPISPFETVVRGESFCCFPFQLEPFRHHFSPSWLAAYAFGLRVIGSSAGTAEEMQDLLETTLAGDVDPNAEVFDFDSIDTVLQTLAKSQIAGRVVPKTPRLALLFNE